MNSESVLIVEDDDALRDMLEEGLAELGFDCLAVNSAEDAIQVLSFFDPRIAVVDIFMRGQGGITAIQIIRRQQPECSIVAVSGGWGEMTPQQSLQAAIDIGAHRSLAKPFSIGSLTTIIRELLDVRPTASPT